MTQNNDDKMVYYTVKDDPTSIAIFYLSILSILAILIGLATGLNNVLLAGGLGVSICMLVSMVFKDYDKSQNF